MSNIIPIKKRTLTLSKSTNTATLLKYLYDELDNLKECPVSEQENARRIMHNISRISAYIDKRWSH